MPRRSESEVSPIARAAIDYRSAGWSVVPLRPHDKRPLVEWERYQHELASLATVAEWYRRWPDANVGVVTGRACNGKTRCDYVIDYTIIGDPKPYCAELCCRMAMRSCFT